MKKDTTDIIIGKIEFYPDNNALLEENQELRIEIEILSKALRLAEEQIKKLKK